MSTAVEQAPPIHPLIVRSDLSIVGTTERKQVEGLADEEWVARTLAGDRAAFNQLVVRYERTAYSVAYRLLQSREAAADAVQESLLKAYRALPSFRNGSFKSWLLRIVVNTCYDLLRSEGHLRLEPIAEDDSDGSSEDRDEARPHLLVDGRETPASFVERQELAARIELGLRALPAEQRMVVVLHDIQGYRYEEISAMTGASLGTVKSRLHRARQSLRDFLLQRPDLLPTLGAYRQAIPAYARSESNR